MILREIFLMRSKAQPANVQFLNLATYDPATNAVEGDKMPDLSTLLTDAQIWDLVKFIKEGAFDVSNFMMQFIPELILPKKQYFQILVRTVMLQQVMLILQQDASHATAQMEQTSQPRWSRIFVRIF